jgi:hypothetical protein
MIQTPRSDIYVAMLGIALAAILIGCLLLLFTWGRYDFKTKPSGAFVASPPSVLVAMSAKPALGLYTCNETCAFV